MQQRQAAREAAVRAKAAQANAERVMEELARAAAQKAAAEPLPEAAAEHGHGRSRPKRWSNASSARKRALHGRRRPRARLYRRRGRRPDAEPATTDKQPDEPPGRGRTADRGGRSRPGLCAIMQHRSSLLTSLVRRFTGGGAPRLEKAPDQVATATVTDRRHHQGKLGDRRPRRRPRRRICAAGRHD